MALLLDQGQPGDVRVNGQRIIGIVYNKAGRAAVRLFYVLFLEIVNLNLVVVPAFGIITGESSGSDI